MAFSDRIPAGLAAAVLACSFSCAASADERDVSELTRAFDVLSQYDWGQSREALNLIDVAVNASHDTDDACEDLRRRLEFILKQDSTRAAKDYACRKLALIGSEKSIPALAGLLSASELSHMSRAALEAIGGPQAALVLRDTLPKLPPILKIGVIHSLGRLRDPKAVPVLSVLLSEPDATVLSASVISLGKIATQEAADELQSFLRTSDDALRPLVHSALLDVAACQLKNGQTLQATELYERLRKGTPLQVQLAAFRGLANAMPAERATRILDALSGESLSLRGVAAELVRTTDNTNTIANLASSLNRLSVRGRAALLEALREQEDASVRTACLAGIRDEDASVRIEALKTLVACGTADDVPALARVATSGSDLRERDIAFDCLRRFPAEGADAAILAGISDPANRTCKTLIRVAVARRSPAANPVLLLAAHAKSASVRIEALTALQHMAEETDALALVELLTKSPEGVEREAADRALRTSCFKIADPQNQANPVLAAFTEADVETRCILLPALGRIGGPRALQVIRSSMEDKDAAIADAAIRGLANWPNSDVAEELLVIAKSSSNPSHRIWTLRAFARVIAQRGKNKPQETFALLKQGMELAERLEEKKLIVSRLTAVRVPEALAMSLSYVDDAALKSDAISSAMSLSEGMKESHPKEARAALERILPLLDDAATRQHIEKLLWNMKQKGN